MDVMDPYGNFEWLATKRRRVDGNFYSNSKITCPPNSQSQSHSNRCCEKDKTATVANLKPTKHNSIAGPLSRTRSKSKSRDRAVTINICQVIKSDLDKRDYHAFTLPNRMKVLVINDPSTEISAAALSIQAGSMLDPREILGMAHLCEHMLLAGTNKYPDDSSFEDFLVQYDGFYSSSTQKDICTHAFQVPPMVLKDCIHRFAQYFILPSFPESMIEDSIQKIQEEFENRRENDEERRTHIAAILSKMDHSFSQFDCGNETTLWKQPIKENLDIRLELLKFYNSFYSPNLMCLVVLGKESCAELQEMVVTNFKRIEDTNKVYPRWVEPPYGPTQFATRIEIEPIQDVKTLFLIFPIPDYSSHYKTGTVPYVRFILSYEGPGSLISYLKKEQLITKAEVDYEQPGSGFAFLTIDFHLTDLGLDKYVEIVFHLFQYLKTIEKEGPQFRLWEEMKIINEIKFRYWIPEEPLEFVENLVALMPVVPQEEILSCRYISGEFKPELIRELILFLSPASVRIIISSKPKSNQSQAQKLFSIDKYYGVKYTYSDIEDEILMKWHTCKLNPTFKFPPPNPFVASSPNLTLKKRDPVMSQLPTCHSPRLVQDIDMSQLWFLQDQEFQIPKATIILAISSSMAKHGPMEWNFTRILAKVVESSLTEFTYCAHAAGLFYSVEGSVPGIILRVHGFDEKLGILFNFVLNRLFHFISYGTVGSGFQNIIKEYIDQLRQWNRQEPHAHALEYLEHLLTSNTWHAQDLLEAMIANEGENMRSSKLVAFAQKYFSRVKLKWFFHGNFTENDCLLIHEAALENFDRIKSKPSIPAFVIPTKEVILSSGVPYLFQTNHAHPTNRKSVTVVLLQCGLAQAQETVILELIESIIFDSTGKLLLSSPSASASTHAQQNQDECQCLCDDEERQIWMDVRKRNEIISFVIVVQAEKDPAAVEEAIEQFLLGISIHLKNLNAEEFQFHKCNLRDRKKISAANLWDKGAEIFQEIFNDTFEFNRRNSELLALENVTQQQICQFYDDFLSPKSSNRKKLSIHIESSLPKVVQTAEAAKYNCDCANNSKTVPDWAKRKTPMSTKKEDAKIDHESKHYLNRCIEINLKKTNIESNDSDNANKKPDITTYFTSEKVTSSQSQSKSNLALNVSSKKLFNKKKGPSLTVSKRKVIIRNKSNASHIPRVNYSLSSLPRPRTVSRSQGQSRGQSRSKDNIENQCINYNYRPHTPRSRNRNNKHKSTDHSNHKQLLLSRSKNDFFKNPLAGIKTTTTLLVQNLLDFSNEIQSEMCDRDSDSDGDADIDAEAYENDNDNENDNNDDHEIAEDKENPKSCFKEYYFQVEEEIQLLSNLKHYLLNEMNKNTASIKQIRQSRQNYNENLDNFNDSTRTPHDLMLYLEGPVPTSRKQIKAEAEGKDFQDEDTNLFELNCQSSPQYKPQEPAPTHEDKFTGDRCKNHRSRLNSLHLPFVPIPPQEYDVYALNSIQRSSSISKETLGKGAATRKKSHMRNHRDNAIAKLKSNNNEKILQPHDRYVIKFEPKTTSMATETTNNNNNNAEGLERQHPAVNARKASTSTERKSESYPRPAPVPAPSEQRRKRSKPQSLKTSKPDSPKITTEFCAKDNMDDNSSLALTLTSSAAQMYDVNELKELDYDIRKEIRRLQRLRKLLDSKAKRILDKKENSIKGRENNAKPPSAGANVNLNANAKFLKSSKLKAQTGPSVNRNNKPKPDNDLGAYEGAGAGADARVEIGAAASECDSDNDDDEEKDRDRLKTKKLKPPIAKAIYNEKENQEGDENAYVQSPKEAYILNKNFATLKKDSEEGSFREEDLIDWIHQVVSNKGDPKAKDEDGQGSKIKRSKPKSNKRNKDKNRSPLLDENDNEILDVNSNFKSGKIKMAQSRSRSRGRELNITDNITKNVTENKARYTYDLSHLVEGNHTAAKPNYEAFVLQATLDYDKQSLHAKKIHNIKQKSNGNPSILEPENIGFQPSSDLPKVPVPPQNKNSKPSEVVPGIGSSVEPVQNPPEKETLNLNSNSKRREPIVDNKSVSKKKPLKIPGALSQLSPSKPTVVNVNNQKEKKEENSNQLQKGIAMAALNSNTKPLVLNPVNQNLVPKSKLIPKNQLNKNPNPQLTQLQSNLQKQVLSSKKTSIKPFGREREPSIKTIVNARIPEMPKFGSEKSTPQLKITEISNLKSQVQNPTTFTIAKGSNIVNENTTLKPSKVASASYNKPLHFKSRQLHQRRCSGHARFCGFGSTSLNRASKTFTKSMSTKCLKNNNNNKNTVESSKKNNNAFAMKPVKEISYSTTSIQDLVDLCDIGKQPEEGPVPTSTINKLILNQPKEPLLPELKSDNFTNSNQESKSYPAPSVTPFKRKKNQLYGSTEEPVGVKISTKFNTNRANTATVDAEKKSTARKAQHGIKQQAHTRALVLALDKSRSYSKSESNKDKQKPQSTQNETPKTTTQAQALPSSKRSSTVTFAGIDIDSILETDSSASGSSLESKFSIKMKFKGKNNLGKTRSSHIFQRGPGVEILTGKRSFTSNFNSTHDFKGKSRGRSKGDNKVKGSKSNRQGKSFKSKRRISGNSSRSSNSLSSSARSRSSDSTKHNSYNGRHNKKSYYGSRVNLKSPSHQKFKVQMKRNRQRSMEKLKAARKPSSREFTYEFESMKNGRKSKSSINLLQKRSSKTLKLKAARKQSSRELNLNLKIARKMSSTGKFKLFLDSDSDINLIPNSYSISPKVRRRSSSKNENILQLKPMIPSSNRKSLGKFLRGLEYPPTPTKKEDEITTIRSKRKRSRSKTKTTTEAERRLSISNTSLKSRSKWSQSKTNIQYQPTRKSSQLNRSQKQRKRSRSRSSKTNSRDEIQIAPSRSNSTQHEPKSSYKDEDDFFDLNDADYIELAWKNSLEQEVRLNEKEDPDSKMDPHIGVVGASASPKKTNKDTDIFEPLGNKPYLKQTKYEMRERTQCGTGNGSCTITNNSENNRDFGSCKMALKNVPKISDHNWLQKPEAKVKDKDKNKDIEVEKKKIVTLPKLYDPNYKTEFVADPFNTDDDDNFNLKSVKDEEERQTEPSNILSLAPNKNSNDNKPIVSNSITNSDVASAIVGNSSVSVSGPQGAGGNATIAAIVARASLPQSYRDPIMQSIVDVQSYRQELIRDIKKWRKDMNYYPPPRVNKK